MAKLFFIKLRSGKKVSSKHPAARSQKFVEELKTGKSQFDGKKLTQRQKAWRAGYMSARQDASAAYKASQNRSNRKFDDYEDIF